MNDGKPHALHHGCPQHRPVRWYSPLGGGDMSVVLCTPPLQASDAVPSKPPGLRRQYTCSVPLFQAPAYGKRGQGPPRPASEGPATTSGRHAMTDRTVHSVRTGNAHLRSQFPDSALGTDVHVQGKDFPLPGRLDRHLGFARQAHEVAVGEGSWGFGVGVALRRGPIWNTSRGAPGGGRRGKEGRASRARRTKMAAMRSTDGKWSRPKVPVATPLD